MHQYMMVEINQLVQDDGHGSRAGAVEATDTWAPHQHRATRKDDMHIFV
jgi:hypothetical protein